MGLEERGLHLAATRMRQIFCMVGALGIALYVHEGCSLRRRHPGTVWHKASTAARPAGNIITQALLCSVSLVRWVPDGRQGLLVRLQASSCHIRSLEVHLGRTKGSTVQRGAWRQEGRQ